MAENRRQGGADPVMGSTLEPAGMPPTFSLRAPVETTNVQRHTSLT